VALFFGFKFLTLCFYFVNVQTIYGMRMGKGVKKEEGTFMKGEMVFYSHLFPPFSQSHPSRAVAEKDGAQHGRCEAARR